MVGYGLVSDPVEPRILAAWHEWLSALATNAEAALAAAHVYAELGDEARAAWLDALEEDRESLGVPRVALYAPLLSVEVDTERLRRIHEALMGEPAYASGKPRALRGIARDRTRVLVLVAPLYMDFVQVLWCRYTPHAGFVWVKHDPFLHTDSAPRAGLRLDDAGLEGVIVEETPLKPVVEELALAILAQRRKGDEIPPAMGLFANLFDARPDADTNGDTQ